MSEANLKLWYLKNLAIFKGAKSEEMKVLDEITVMKNYTKKEYIYFSKADIDRIYIIKQGNVEIGYLDESGKEFAIDIVGMGEIFGTILGQEGAGGYARVVDRALICHMSRIDFEEYLERFPGMSLRVLKFLGFKINILENKLQNLVFKDIRTRICELLSSLYEKSGDVENKLIKISLTHRDIANLVGCTRETASLNLSELKKEGIITYHKKRIKILSESRLKKCRSIS
ncbi:MAG: Crp/Fnr family transcriptional regulator [Calditrichia bacterium]|nr:Crp/Fnr family transcriptional regulator [Calditrichia bacterium]